MYSNDFKKLQAKKMLNVIMLKRLALRVATVLQYSCNTKLPTQDDCYDYGLYPFVDRYSMDQVNH